MNEVHTFFNQLLIDQFLDLPFKKSLLSSLDHKQLKDEHAFLKKRKDEHALREIR